MISVKDAIIRAISKGGTSYRTLSRLSGYDHAYLHNIAKGKKAPPASAEFYRKLGDALGINPENFLEQAKMEIDYMLALNPGEVPYVYEVLSNRVGYGKGERNPEPYDNVGGAEEGLFLDEGEFQAYVDSKPLDLTFTEFKVLAYLYKHRGATLTREAILREVWGYEYFGDSRTLDVHIRRIRSKLGARHQDRIQTVRNVGYRLVREL